MYSLEQAIGFDPDSDSEDEDAIHHQQYGFTQKQPFHFSAKPALNHATAEIISSIAQQRDFASSNPEDLHGLSANACVSPVRVDWRKRPTRKPWAPR